MNSSYAIANQSDLGQEKSEKKLLQTSLIEPVRGYLYGLLFVVFATAYAILLKLCPAYTTYNLLAIRYVIQTILVAFLILRSGADWFGPKGSRTILLVRGFSGACSVFFGIVSLKYLEISDVETLFNTTVITTAVLGRVFLNEKITASHLFSLLITIAGVLFILKPHFLFGAAQHDNETSLADYSNRTSFGKSHFSYYAHALSEY